MASNPYVNKVQKADGTTIIDISDTTATASDVASGKYFYTAAGVKTQGTLTSDGYKLATSVSMVNSLKLEVSGLDSSPTEFYLLTDFESFSQVTMPTSAGSAYIFQVTYDGSSTTAKGLYLYRTTRLTAVDESSDVSWTYSSRKLTLTSSDNSFATSKLKLFYK